MATYIVTYDLSGPSRNYGELLERIKSYGSWAHITESSWAISTTEDPVAIRDHLMGALDNNDNLFVGTLSWSAWVGLGQDVSDWLKSNL